MDEPNNNPDLEFITEGTRSIMVPNGKLSEFCPLITICDKKDLDDNCFYSKFLHCDCGKKHYDKLSKEDKFNLKYKEFDGQIGIGS